MLESAALEDDEFLQDVWARLIANCTDPNFKLALHPGYIEIIKQLSPDEALILKSFLKLEKYPILFTHRVPRTIAYTENIFTLQYDFSPQKNEASYKKVHELYQTHCKTLTLRKPNEMQVYIDNLIRLRIVELNRDFMDEDRDEASIFGRRKHVTPNSDAPSISIPARDEFLRMTTFGQNFLTACMVDGVPFKK